jgi:hypothetical protein
VNGLTGKVRVDERTFLSGSQMRRPSQNHLIRIGTNQTDFNGMNNREGSSTHRTGVDSRGTEAKDEGGAWGRTTPRERI